MNFDKCKSLYDCRNCLYIWTNNEGKLRCSVYDEEVILDNSKEEKDKGFTRTLKKNEGKGWK